MYSELEHSKSLSKRFKRNFSFQYCLVPPKNLWVNVENGINKASFIQEYESLFSKVSSFDSEDDFKKLLDETSKNGIADCTADPRTQNGTVPGRGKNHRALTVPPTSLNFLLQTFF